MLEHSKKPKWLLAMVTGIVSIVVISSLIFNFVIYSRELQVAQEHFAEIGSNFTAQSSHAFEIWLEDQIRIVSIISEHPTIVEACRDPYSQIKRERAEGFLRELHGQFPYYESIPVALVRDEKIDIYEAERRITVAPGAFFLDTVDGNLLGKGGVELSYIDGIIDGKPFYISEIYMSINSGEPVVAISKPVYLENELVGVAVVTPKVEYFTSRFIDPVTHGTTGYMMLVDERGMVLSHPEKSEILKSYEDQREDSQKVINRILMGQTYFRETVMNYDKSFYSKHLTIDSENQPYDWYMVFSMHDSEIYANANQVPQLSIGMVAIGALTVSAVVYVYAQSLQTKFIEIQRLEMTKKLEDEVAARTNELAELAIRDGLTKLYNHDAAYKALEMAIKNAKISLNPLSIIMIDLDHFKKLNDSYGHLFGDEVLKVAAEVIRAAVRSTDIVGRYGGEEFIIILAGADKASAVLTGKRIMEGLQSMTLSVETRVTASMGVAAWIGDDVEDLIKRADDLLYQAKSKGRNRIETTLESDNR